MTPLFVAIGLYRLVSLGGAGYAAAVQRFLVAPNELDRETPYILHNIAATRRAFALENVEERELSGRRGADARRHRRATPPRSRTCALWDHQPLLDTFGQIQEIRHVLRLRLRRQRPLHDQRRVPADHAVGPRAELRRACPTGPGSTSGSTFTHGYGLTLGPVNQVTPEGLPVLFISDLPPVSTVDLQVDGAEHLLRRAVEQLRLRADRARGSSTTRRARTTLPPRTRARRRAGRRRSGARLLFAIRFRAQHILLQRRHHARQPHPVPPPDQRAGADDRAVPHLRRRPVPGASPTGGCSGSRTPTRQQTSYPYSTPRRRTASTTSATR